MHISHAILHALSAALLLVLFERILHLCIVVLQDTVLSTACSGHCNLCFMLKRHFLRGILNHCYQRSADGGLIFYCQSDYLVWFTTVCIAARRHNIKVLALCPMPDHTHMSVIADSVQQLSAFMGEANRSFSFAQNQVCNTKISWFEHTFGSAVKKGAKDARSNLIYVGNNPVERQLSANAEDYRWTFVAYAQSNHPFSEKLVIRNASWHLKNAIREVRAQSAAGKPLKYNQLKRMIAKLDVCEKQQLTDFIIATYNVIDYMETLRYFDGEYENYRMALHTTVGHEYDLNETFVGRSDAHYSTMVKTILADKHLADIHDFLSWPIEERLKLRPLLQRNTKATDAQIYKFLHLPWKKTGRAPRPYAGSVSQAPVRQYSPQEP